MILESELAGARLPVDAVITTAELVKRRSRPPDYRGENRALTALVLEMANSPSTVLETLADTALTLCKAHSAGISILEEENGEKIFRWHAVVGKWSRFLGGTMLRAASPCGTVLDRNCSLLVSSPERAYPLPPVDPPIVEVLLIPFHEGNDAIGTIWVIAHDASRRFDAEDERLMKSIGRFASAAWAVSRTRSSGGNAPSPVRPGPNAAAGLVEHLSARELEVLARILAGEETKKIAFDLDVSDKTIATYRARVMKKLNLRSNHDLFVYAVRHRLVDWT